MSIGEKLNMLLLENDSNPNKLSEETGISPSTIYSIIKRNNTKVDLSVLQIISDKFNVSLEYFSEGGSKALPKTPFTVSEPEKEHIKKYRILDKHGKDMVDTVLDKEYSRVQETPAK